MNYKKLTDRQEQLLYDCVNFQLDHLEDEECDEEVQEYNELMKLKEVLFG